MFDDSKSAYPTISMSERLRLYRTEHSEGGPVEHLICNEAADYIEALESQLQEHIVAEQKQISLVIDLYNQLMIRADAKPEYTEIICTIFVAAKQQWPLPPTQMPEQPEDSY